MRLNLGDLPCSWRTVLQPIHLSFFVMKPASPPTFDVTTVFTDVCSPSEYSHDRKWWWRFGSFFTHAEGRIRLWNRPELARKFATMVWRSAARDNILYRSARCYPRRRPDPERRRDDLLPSHQRRSTHFRSFISRLILRARNDHVRHSITQVGRTAWITFTHLVR